MIDAFKIYVDQLRGGKEEILDQEFSPGFLQISEPDLSFKAPVKVEGTVYLADDELVLNLNVNTFATLPCAICNASVNVPIAIQNSYHAVPVKEIKTGIYDYGDLLRETILLETPQFAECNDGDCPEREKVRKYFKKLPEEGGSSPDDEGYRPFSDLEWDKNK